MLGELHWLPVNSRVQFSGVNWLTVPTIYKKLIDVVYHAGFMLDWRWPEKISRLRDSLISRLFEIK